MRGIGLITIGFFAGFYMVPLYTLLQHRAPKTSKGDMIATSNFINVTGAMAASALFFILVQMGRVTHFEIHADDPERASLFYSSIFDWKIVKWEGPMDYWLVSTGESVPGIDGGIVPRRGEKPGSGAACNAFVCTIGVDSLDDAIAATEKNGGIVVVPKVEIPGVGWLAYAHDTEGNVFGMMQSTA